MSTSHWTTDSDLLEHYVLNKLEAEQRIELESHLAFCAECAQRVGDEMRLIAGIKAAGRQALKKRLKDRLKTRTYRDIPLARVAGLAAAVVFLITIAIYTNWFVQEEDRVELETTDAHDRQTLSAEEGVKETSVTPGKAAELSVSPEIRDTRAGTAQGIPPFQSQGEEPRMRLEIVQPESKSQQPAEMLYGHTASPRTEQFAASIQGRTVWIQGTIIPQREVEGRDEVVPAEVDEARRQNALLLKQRGIAPAQKSVRGMTKEESGGVLELTQRLLGELPPSERAKQAEKEGSHIPTLIEQTDSLVQMVLFFETPVPEEVFDRATLVRVAADSILLHIGSRMIGYRLPAGFELPQQLRQGRR
jgi:hypothetical protein